MTNYSRHLMPKNRRTWAILAFLTLALAITYPFAQHHLAEYIRQTRIPILHHPAPPFTLKNAAGRPINLTQFKNKVILLNFWATWCGPCKIETPWFIEFQQTFAAQNFTVLGISMDDDGWPVITPWLREHHVNYPILLGTPDLYGGIEALPTTFLIGRDGKIAAIHTGLIPKAQYEKEIRDLLQ